MCFRSFLLRREAWEGSIWLTANTRRACSTVRADPRPAGAQKRRGRTRQHDPLHGVYTQPTLSSVNIQRNLPVRRMKALSPNPDQPELHRNAAFKFARTRQNNGRLHIQCTPLALNRIQHGFPG
ncbi:hypothetical protein BD310DRAFT_927034 [Dichomitus squalens]|uniref:Uncharacterized protein n=1 Tax=Dichomitus squalens TaxID=114155 RepID=A0A4Q9PVF4_9APHY|nr:hypothetical protein BD310DRAFT_927034 [Dichomitus squalens]